MAKTKDEIIKALNEIKNNPLNELKKDPVANSNGTNHKALMQYNAMLDNIAIGAHTNTTVHLYGRDWTLRLLNYDEYVTIRKEVIQEMKEDELFDDWYSRSLTLLKFLTRALTPSPFKLDGPDVLTENDLRQVNHGVLEEVYEEYFHFIHMATKKADQFTEEEIQALISIVKKKPEGLKALGRAQLLIVSEYFRNYSLNLETIVKPE